jgi:hypothetical protein
MENFSLEIYFKPGLQTDIFFTPPEAVEVMVQYVETIVKTWDGASRSHIFSKESIASDLDPVIGRLVLPRGLVKWFIRSLHEDGFITNGNLKIVDELKDSFHLSRLDLSLYYDLYDLEEKKTIRLRDYQQEGILTALSDFQGIIAHPTGSGKGEEILVLSNILLEHGNVLILCPSGASLRSTAKRFELYGVSYCEYLDVRDEEDVEVAVIGTPKAILNDLRNFRPNFLKNIRYLISNEAHHAKGTSWYDVSIELPNVLRSYGFTATPDIISKRPIHESHKYEAMIRGSHGEVVHEKTSKELAEYLSAPLNLRVMYSFPYKKKNQDLEFSWGYNKRFLNADRRLKYFSNIAHIINDYSDFTSITFVSEKANQGDKLYEWYPDLTATWYGGGVIENNCGLDLDIDSIFSAIIEGHVRHTIVTSHAREDINLPTLNFALVFELVKRGPIKQACGRVSRPNSPSFFVNLCDTAPGLLALQADKRSNIVEEEYGKTPLVCKTLDDFKQFVSAAAEAFAKK